MKNITNYYKNKIPIMGRQIDSKISYTIEGTTTELGKEQLNSVTPHYESQILKSTMKQLDIDSNVDIPLNTTLNYQFGVLVNNDYEYINYGNYVVYSSEKQEDTNSYRIICYDKMLYSMIDYTKMNITYPITIRNYIQAICDTIGLNFKNTNDEFANYDKEIQNELYFDADGKSLGYKFRDVLDELAQVTGSTICISEDDELEIRYTNDLINESKEVEGNPITIQDNEGEIPLDIELKGNTTQQTSTASKNIIDLTKVPMTDVSTGLSINSIKSNEISIKATTSVSDWGRVQFNITNLLENNKKYYLGVQSNSANTPNTAGRYATISIYRYPKPSGSAQTVTEFNITSNGSIYYLNFTPDTTNYDYRLLIFPQSGVVPSSTKNYVYEKIYLAQENSASSYVPFTPNSPSPDYPQPINNVTGRQEIDVVGKNLFDGPLELGGYNPSNGSKMSANDNYRCSNKIPVQPNTTYTISIDGVAQQYLMFYYGSDGTYISYGDNRTGTFTTSNNCYYITFRCYATDFTNDYANLNVQLEKGTTATTYEPYIGKKYEINLGNNLFDKNTITWVRNNNDNYTSTGNTNTTRIRTQQLIQLTGGETYTISGIPSGISLGIVKFYASTSSTTVTSYTNTTTFTVPTNATYVIFQMNGTGFTDETNTLMEEASIQVEKGSQATTYAPYKTPIELCKIGDYQDYIRKSTGKNLFDVNNMTLNEYLDGEGNPGTSIYWDITNYIEVKPNTKYTYRGLTQVGSNAVQSVYYNKNKEKISTFKQATGTNTITTPDNCYYIRFSITKNLVNDKYVFMIEEGTQATTYEPYGKVWYIHKETEKVVLDGSESWNLFFSTNGIFVYNPPQRSLLTDNTLNGLSNYYTNVARQYIRNNLSEANNVFSIYAQELVVANKSVSSVSDFKTLLSNNNLIVYYILYTPTNTEITDTELINQLERIKLLNGLNQISLSSDGTLKLSYVSDYEYIDENYLKDINVNFGEKYGPVNSIVLSRSAGADNVYLRDEDSIAEDGLCEIKISDNQIMNFNDRDTYLPDLLKTLKGYGYYLNDFSSTGITFYELCDKYRVKIGDTKYPCIMYNDEVLVTQGLQENVHTDRPEESETPYSKSDTTDRRINQTNLIVNKQTGQIEALTTKTEDIEEDLSENYYTKTMTNQLIQEAETGVTNTFSEAGGNNILRNTNFAAKEVLETGQEYEYWYGSVVKTTNNNSVNGMSILLQNGNLYQEQQVANGTYTVSFYYKKLNPLATGKLVVNGTEYALTEDDYTLFQTGLKDEVGAYITQPIIVNDNYLKVQFTSDTNNAFEIYDIMCNFGTVKLAYSQNQNETITNTVNISKGITITASDKDVKFVATPDGIRIKNKDTDEIITDFTDKGMDTKNAIIEESATIVGIYRQKVGDQVWDSLM